MGGAITISNQEDNGSCMAALARTGRNEYTYPNIAVSETRFLGVLVQH